MFVGGELIKTLKRLQNLYNIRDVYGLNKLQPLLGMAIKVAFKTVNPTVEGSVTRQTRKTLQTP